MMIGVAVNNQCVFAIGFSGFILAIIFGSLRLLFNNTKIAFPDDPISPEPESAAFARLRTIEEIYKLDPVAFERFVKSMFERMGYTVETTAITGDNGIDLVLHKNGEMSIAQCKRFAKSVGQPVLRDLYGAMFDKKAKRAYLVTTGTFTAAAEAWSEGKSLVLVDGPGIVDWINNLPDK